MTGSVSPASTGPLGVGVIGAGNISAAYLRNLTRFPDLEVHIVGDLLPAAAAARAEEFGVGDAGTPEDVMTHPGVELVVNLTIPAAHAEVSSAAVRAGKHVWSEKPITLDRESADQLLREAAAAGVRIGCAPDTVLGAGIQSARRVIESGGIGRPLSGLTLFQTPGPQLWHPNPDFLFQLGAGPLFDMGPYYLTTLIQTLGPIRRVAAVGTTTSPTRVIGAGPRAGQEFAVEVPTQVGLIAAFESGATAQSMFSFDSPLVRTGFVEITGSEATLSLPDPNAFDGALRIRRLGSDDWEDLPVEGAAEGRGTGVLDMARAIRAGTPHRIGGDLARHVLDVMISAADSMSSGAFVPLTSTVGVPEPLPVGWDPLERTL